MSKDFILVDGSMGEGGGQVLRASLALSAALGKPFRMSGIRAGRPKPGLKRQHLTCVRAVRDICGAMVTGDEIGSMELSFAPGPVQPGEYRFDIGSGGSCTLVLQALLPALLTAKGKSRITVTGGTHVPFAPPFEFMKLSLFPLLEKMGPRLSASIQKAGYMQVGGGSVQVEIEPVFALSPLHICAEEAVKEIYADIYLHNIDKSVAERETETLLSPRSFQLGLEPGQVYLNRLCREQEEPEGSGNAVLVTLRHKDHATVCSEIGQRGRAAEVVARKAATRALRFRQSGAPVEEHLADQLIVPLALAGGGSFLTEKPTLHTTTCMELLPLFLPVTTGVEQKNDRQYLVSVQAI